MKERFYTLGLVVRCLLRALMHGRAVRRSQAPRSIVIVQFGKLGDMVCTTPMFRAVKHALPEVRLIVVGDRVGGEVLAGNADVDRYIVCGPDISVAHGELKEEHPDIGITAGPSVRALALLYLAGVRTLIAPRVEGGRSSESTLYKVLRVLAIPILHRIGRYAPREYLRLLEPLGVVDSDTTKHLSYSDAAASRISNLLAGHGVSTDSFLVGIAPSAGNKIKEWPPERFAAVAEHLHTVYRAFIVLVAGPGDAPEVDAMRRALPHEISMIGSPGLFSIEELKACVAQLSLFVSVDTGPIYIAEAFDTPTVDITGPIDENEQPPQGERHVIVTPSSRVKPELFVMNPYGYNYTEARRQIESITAVQVTSAIDGLLQRLHLPS